MLSATPPQPAIHVAESFIDVLSRCCPPTCSIAFEQMKGSHDVKTSLLNNHPGIFCGHQRKNMHGIFHLRSL